MKNNLKKSLIKVNENSILYKLKMFFIKFIKFKAEENTENVENIEKIKNLQENSKNTFLESIKNIENEETKLLKLQKQYRNGEITENDLTKEQIELLCALYDKQILQLKKLNATLKNAKV